MIIDIKQLKEFLVYEGAMYPRRSVVRRYLRLLRLSEYCKYRGGVLIIAYRVLNHQKNRIGSRYGVEIPPDVFGKGLRIYHFQNIIVNTGSKIGENCSIIGNVCIGGKNGGKGAQIGDNCELGVFSAVIGDLVLGDNVKVGAGAIVTKSFPKDNIVLVGVPAREL